MKIRSVDFAGSVGAPGQAFPGDLPQVAFSGRSNVGKSSLINTLLRRTRNRIAKVSATPGKTQTLNFYRVNDRFFLVDLPGYGYARAPAAVREQWRALVEGYLAQERGGALVGVVHLVDARHGPTRLDHQMMAYLATVGVPTLVVATKIDKLGRERQRKALETVQAELGLDSEQMVPFSSKTGEGRDALLEALDALLGEGESAPGAGNGGPEGER